MTVTFYVVSDDYFQFQCLLYTPKNFYILQLIIDLIRVNGFCWLDYSLFSVLWSLCLHTSQWVSSLQSHLKIELYLVVFLSMLVHVNRAWLFDISTSPPCKQTWIELIHVGGLQPCCGNVCDFSHVLKENDKTANKACTFSSSFNVLLNVKLLMIILLNF